MTTFRPSSPPKRPELNPKEVSALRDVSNHRAVETQMIQRLAKLGVIEQRSGVWSTTQHGAILLMLGAARWAVTRGWPRVQAIMNYVHIHDTPLIVMKH